MKTGGMEEGVMPEPQLRKAPQGLPDEEASPHIWAAHHLGNLKRLTAVNLKVGKQPGGLILQTKAPGKGQTSYNEPN